MRHSLPGHFPHITILCVCVMWQGWCEEFPHSSWHLRRTLTVGVAGMSRCRDKIWKDTYSPSAGADAIQGAWPSDYFLKDRCEEFQDYQSKNYQRADSTIASDQAGITTEQAFTHIRGFLHAYADVWNQDTSKDIYIYLYCSSSTTETSSWLQVNIGCTSLSALPPSFDP